MTANVAPKLTSQMCHLALTGNYQGAAQVDEQLQPLHKALFVESNPIPVKWALMEMGLIDRGIRLPMTPLSDQYHDQIRAALRMVGALTT